MSRAKKSPVANWRYHALVIAIGLCCLVLVGKLFHIQIIQHAHYTALAEQQYGEERIIPSIRGTIKSSDGFDLATTQPAYLISANPQLLKDPVKAARDIVEALHSQDDKKSRVTKSSNFDDLDDAPAPTKTKEQEIADLTKALSDKNRAWVLIGRKIEKEIADEIKKLELPGMDYKQDPKRFYPEGTLASHVLGFVGKDTEGNDHGYYGIEGYFNRDLTGKDGRIVMERDATGNPIPIGNYVTQPVVNGSTITLTINRSLQYLLEEKLKQGVEDNHAEAGSVIVMEPDTGRILVMANYPTYDPGNWMEKEVQEKQLFKNRAISDTYEPGSVMKAFTAATGIDLGLFGPKSTYVSEPYKVYDHTITTADRRYYGVSTLTDMLIRSDNTGAAQFAMEIGQDKFLEAIHEIGLDRPTGITLEGEGQSIIPYANNWLPITLATAAFGQGISVTPIQLLESMATIANGGVQMKPTILSSVEQNGRTTEVKPEKVGRIFSQETSDQVVDMLYEVVKKGEFRRLATQGYGIAGKTSTSQIPIAGGYDPDDTITTFVGFAPAHNPEFIMLAKLDRPAITNSAETVVPMWMDMAKDLFNFYGIGPEDTSQTEGR